SISGNAVEGSILTATPVQTSDEVETVHYQWQSSADGTHWSAIAGAADASTYTLAEGDENLKIRVEASLTDDTGQSVSADSLAFGKVVDVAPTLSVSLSGNAVEGSILTATPVQTSDEVETVHYQWQSSADGTHWSAIAGAADASSYTLAEGDESLKIRVEASLTDDTGQSAIADSNVLGTVVDVAPAPATPTVSGSAGEGSTLAAAGVA